MYCLKVMESLEHAMKRDAPILAEYLGGAVRCDAYHITNPRLDGIGLLNCIQRSLVNARVSVEEVLHLSSFIFCSMMFNLQQIHILIIFSFLIYLIR